MNELVGKWNYYFLRYFVGTIIGAIIVAFCAKNWLNLPIPLQNYFLSKDNGDKSELGGSTITVLLILGFAYCYIASAPGTVFHAVRGLFWEKKEKTKDETPKKFPFWPFPLASIAFAIIFVLFCFPCSCFCHRFWITFRLVPCISVLIFQWLLIFFAFFGHKQIKTFYDELTKRREKGLVKKDDKGNKVSEYVESYRHLREHGNAFEIVFLELALAGTLSLLHGCFLYSFIAIWILPAALCWVVGTRLEFHIPDGD